MTELNIPKAPLFRDPIYDGAADPTIIWNRQERSWWLLYTARRANVACPGFSWVHGTDIGIASSHDGGRSWIYRGILNGLEFENGRNTFWAPEVIFAKGVYHMYVSYVRGIPADWLGERHIIHYTGKNLWEWRFASVLALSSDAVIDACVHKLPDGTWRMWYKDEAHGSHTYAADSEDLFQWQPRGPVITDCPHEGPNVFFWRNAYWMITDPWNGFAVYQSPDCQKWFRQKNILDLPGKRQDDTNHACHGDVLVRGEKAYLFYHVHPETYRDDSGNMLYSMPYASKRSVLQVAELDLEMGAITSNRDRNFDFILPPEGE